VIFGSTNLFNAMHVRISLVALFIIMSLTSFSQVSKTRHANDSIAVMSSFNSFIDAFTNLKRDQFSNCFADDATGFFPGFTDVAERVNTKAEMLSVFDQYFQKTKREKSGPPYLVIEPRDVRVQINQGIAILTFHVLGPGLIGRRTLVYRNDGAWKIIHMHGSQVQR
jgi:hypothetical protein